MDPTVGSMDAHECARTAIRSAANCDKWMSGAAEVPGLPVEGDIVMRLPGARQTVAYATIGPTAGLGQAVAAATAAAQRVRSATDGDSVTVCLVQEGGGLLSAAGELAGIAASSGFGRMQAAVTLCFISPQASSGAWTAAAAEEAAAAALPGQQVRVLMSPRLRADGTTLGMRLTGGGGFFCSSELAAHDWQAEQQAAAQAASALAVGSRSQEQLPHAQLAAADWGLSPSEAAAMLEEHEMAEASPALPQQHQQQHQQRWQQPPDDDAPGTSAAHAAAAHAPHRYVQQWGSASAQVGGVCPFCMPCRPMLLPPSAANMQAVCLLSLLTCPVLPCPALLVC